jgi:hypothetical protein
MACLSRQKRNVWRRRALEGDRQLHAREEGSTCRKSAADPTLHTCTTCRRQRQLDGMNHLVTPLGNVLSGGSDHAIKHYVEEQ